MATVSFQQQRINIEQNPALKTQLNSYMLMDPESEANSAQKYETLWQVAYITSVVATIALAFVGIVYFGMTNPGLIPFLLGGVMAYYSLSNPLYTYLKNNSSHNEQLKIVAQGTLEKISELESRSSNDLLLKLYSLTPRWNQDRETREILSQVDPVDFKRAYIPIIAHHDYWKDVATRAHNKAQDYFTRANELRTELETTSEPISDLQRTNIENKVLKFRLLAYEYIETQELPAKINAAFMLYHLKTPFKPEGEGTEERKEVDLSSFGKFNMLEFTQREMFKQQETEEDNRDPYWVKQDGHKVGRDWILNHSYQEIAHEIFAI